MVSGSGFKLEKQAEEARRLGELTEDIFERM